MGWGRVEHKQLDEKKEFSLNVFDTFSKPKKSFSRTKQ